MLRHEEVRGLQSSDETHTRPLTPLRILMMLREEAREAVAVYNPGEVI